MQMRIVRGACWIAVPLYFVTACTGIPEDVRVSSDDGQIKHAAIEAFLADYRTRPAVLTPFDEFSSVDTGDTKMDSISVTRDRDDRSLAIVQADAVMPLTQAPTPEAANILRVFPSNGLTIAVHRHVTGRVRKINGKWSFEPGSLLIADRDTSLPDRDRQQARDVAVRATRALLTATADFAAYNSAQDNFYATRTGTAGLVHAPGSHSTLHPPSSRKLELSIPMSERPLGQVGSDRGRRIGRRVMNRATFRY
jgi:hypothetical protein